MNNDKYVAMDVHKASVVIGVRDGAGKMISQAIVETKAQTLKDYVKSLSGKIHLTFEEGTQSAWLYDLLRPLVAECIVCDPRRNKLLESGNKSDDIDVAKLSELLYLGRLRPVYHGHQGTRALKELAHNLNRFLPGAGADCQENSARAKFVLDNPFHRTRLKPVVWN